jgi:hypothetical protein
LAKELIKEMNEYSAKALKKPVDQVKVESADVEDQILQMGMEVGLMTKIPVFLETYYLRAVFDHVRKNVLSEFYNSFTTPQEFEWKSFLDMVRKLQAKRIAEFRQASKNQNLNSDMKPKKPKHWSLPFQDLLNSESFKNALSNCLFILQNSNIDDHSKINR